MKVFKIDLDLGYGCQLTFIAAASVDEALQIYKDLDCKTPPGCSSMIPPTYQAVPELFEEVLGLSWSGEPGVIAHQHYEE